MMRFFGVIIVLVALAAGLVLVRQNQETRRGAAYAEVEALFLPDSNKVKVGEEIVSTFMLDTKTHKLTGVEVRIKYDAGKLELVGGGDGVKPVVVGQGSGTALFRAESDVLTKSVDGEKGLITIAGISMEEEVDKMAMGAVALIKMTFKAKSAGSAMVTLDSTYDNMATGYNPSSNDQTLAIKTVKSATYVVSSTVTPVVTQVPTATVAPTAVPTSVALSCKWCGTSCVSSTYKGMCVDVMPPADKKCMAQNGQCVIVGAAVTAVPTVTPIGNLSCNQRCSTNYKCASGLACVPIWWPVPCGEMPPTLLKKVNQGQLLTVTDVASAVKICPEVKNLLLPAESRDNMREDGTIVGSITSVASPTMIGVCRNVKCLGDTDCVCGGVIPTLKPTATPTAISNKPYLYMSLAKRTVAVNETFQMTLGVDSGNEKSGAVDVWMNFDSSKLEVLAVDYPKNPAFKYNLGKNIQNDRGQFDLSCTSMETSTSMISKIKGDLAVITFRAKSAGVSPVTYWCVPKSTVDTNIFNEQAVDVIDCASNVDGQITVTGDQVSPGVTGVGGCSCPGGVPAKREGNADCSGKVDLVDFEMWRSEAFDKGGIEGKMSDSWKADFNCDRRVNLSDFEMWRMSYFK